VINVKYNFPVKQQIGGERKMKKILQISWKVKVTKFPPIDKIDQSQLQAAKSIANVKGVLWKIWMTNEAEKSAGGIYLFEDDASLQAYLKGEVIARMKSNLSDFEAKVFDILPESTKITRGPVD